MALEVQWLGRRAYAPVWELQRSLQSARITALEAGQPHPETLLLVEHEPVFTWGRRTKAGNLGQGPEALRAAGAEVFEVERGGEVTYHGPGQLVGYPIVHLGALSCRRDLHAYMRALEETLIQVLAGYGLQGTRLPGRTGVWVGAPGAEAKVAALGVRVSKWVAMHGFALNVSNEPLPWFRLVTPCGIADRAVTSLQALLGKAPPMEDVRARVEAAFREVMGL